MNSCRQDWDNTIRPFDAPAPLSVWLPPSSKPAHTLTFCLDPTRPKTCRLASHMHIKPGELENILLARELEELPEPRAVDWSQALGLTTLDPRSRCFLPLSPSYLFPSDVVLTLRVLPFCFGVFLRVGRKNHFHCVLGKELQHLSLPPVWLPFPLPPLFLQLLPYLCEKGVAVTAERRYWSLQISNSYSGGRFFAKAVLKNPAFWKYTSLCKCSPLPMFFHCLHLFLISLLFSWGNVSAVMFLTADDFGEQLSRFGVQNGQLLYGFINMFIICL